MTTGPWMTWPLTSRTWYTENTGFVEQWNGASACQLQHPYSFYARFCVACANPLFGAHLKETYHASRSRIRFLGIDTPLHVECLLHFITCGRYSQKGNKKKNRPFLVNSRGFIQLFSLCKTLQTKYSHHAYRPRDCLRPGYDQVNGLRVKKVSSLSDPEKQIRINIHSPSPVVKNLTLK